MRILKSALSVGSNTLLSRIVGFIRDIFIARLLGAGNMADIWVAAFRFPNLFRRIVAEGAFSAAFIPIYGRIISENGKEEADKFSGNILSMMGLWIVAGIIILQLLMPYLIYIFAPGFSDGFTNWIKDIFYFLFYDYPYPLPPVLSGDDKISMAASLTILCLPYAGFMFVAALISAILNYNQIFYAPSFAPVLLNISLIISMIISIITGYNPLWTLGYGVLFAGFLQILWLYLNLRHKGLKIKFGRIKTDNNISVFKKLFWPGIFSGGITQINLLIGSLIASFQSGAMAVLYYADRIYQLPLGVIGVTLGIVLLPNLVKNIHSNNMKKAQNLLMRSSEIAALLTLPSVMAMLIIPDNIVRILFEYGEFTKNDSLLVSNSLIIYAFGLPAFILIKIYASGFYAFENTKKPMIYAGQSVIINIILSIALFPLIGFYAIIIGTVISSWFNSISLFYGLKKSKLIIFNNDFYKRITKIIISTLIMGASLLLIKNFFYMHDAIIILFGMLSYFLSIISVRVFSKSEFKNLLSK